jgi:predicted nucleic acid-binding protein
MLVLDANILIRAVLGRRVRQLLETYSAQGIRFLAPDPVFQDAAKYLPHLLRRHGKPDTDLPVALEYLAQIIEDLDFFGTGIAVWTTSRVEIFLKLEARANEPGPE